MSAKGAERTLSLRWRLSLTYAGMALFTAAVLGGVLLSVLGNYYARAEDGYLLAAAQRVRTDLTRTGTSRAALARQAKIAALTTQTRVRVYDAAGELLADSGSPTQIDPSTLSRSPSGEPQMNGRRSPLPPPLGTGPFSSSSPGSPRSARTLRAALIGSSGVSVGALVLSEGPASGSDVLAGVAQALALAALVAVLFAAFAGFVVSRRISRPIVALTTTTGRMAQGDLAARAEVERRDEVGHLAVSFNAMAERIEHTVTALRRFVADAAHEIGTPLTALQADLELAETAPTARDRARLLSLASVQARRLEDLSSSLLRLSRLEADTASAQHQAIDAAAALRAAADSAASRASQAGIALTTELPSVPLDVHASEDQLATVIGNLLDNSIKFTPRGGEVALGARQEGRDAVIRVSDTGVGIPVEQQSEVFERFFRGRNVPALPGSGLGLAIVRATLDALDGSVSFTSSETGTEFEVRLPLA